MLQEHFIDLVCPSLSDMFDPSIIISIFSIYFIKPCIVKIVLIILQLIF